MRRDTLVVGLIGLAVAVLLWFGIETDARADLASLRALFREAAGQVWHSWFG